MVHEMGYDLLTGATGLLGSYLVREYLREGRRLAVVVRAAARESARQRVENIVVRWEKELGYLLPRPVVLEGDICRPGLGLEPGVAEWIARHCRSVIHNAASLTFQPDDRRGEPHRTNVEGTRNVLELCRSAGIRQFHHVSTAFICGLRQGRILESEVDLGQQYGNVYEKSKITAEKMVRAAEFLDPPTIYRPATIVGDSRTGYTTTYHGFYAPLKLVHAVADRVDLSVAWGQPLMQLLGLSGTERKNFVPVDWVAAVIAHIQSHPQLHGQTYHLTPRIPVRVAMVTEVMEEVVRESAHRPKRLNPEEGLPDASFDLSNFARLFQEQMEVYQSHWRDDPQFDYTNTAVAAPHLPSPEVDRVMLKRIAAFAVRANFGWPRPPSIKPEFDVQEHLSRWLEAGKQVGPEANACLPASLEVSGPGGGQWQLLVHDGRLVGAQQGIGSDCDHGLYLNSKTFHRLVRRQLNAGQAIRTGEVLVEGRRAEPERLEAILHAAVTEEGA